MPRHVVILGPVSPDDRRPVSSGQGLALARSAPSPLAAPPFEVPSPPPGVSRLEPSALVTLAGGRRRRAGTGRRRRRTPWPIPVLAVLCLAVGLVWQLGGSATSANLVLARGRPVTVGGTVPALPWPQTGQAALSVPAAGVTVTQGPETPVPIASLTKMMTALVVLHDHPLGPSAAGPQVTMTAADQQDAAADSAANDTSIPVTAGESVTERQLLDGLLVHSANDFAVALANWDAGSLTSFVAKMNATAAALQMSQTHYVDPNGIGPGDTSSPRDQLKLASLAMAIPAFAAVVAQPAIVAPGAGLLSNYISMVGTRGVVGVKSGFTQAAGACVVLAADRQVDGQQVLVMAAVTGQQGFNALNVTAARALALIDAATGALHVRTLVPAGTVEGSLTASWTSRRPALVTASDLTTPVWPGTHWTSTFTARRLTGNIRAGEAVGTLTLTDGSQSLSVPVVSTGDLRQPSRGWRLAHS